MQLREVTIHHNTTDKGFMAMFLHHYLCHEFWGFKGALLPQQKHSSIGKTIFSENEQTSIRLQATKQQ